MCQSAPPAATIWSPPPSLQSLPTEVLKQLEEKVTALGKKYESTYADIDTQIREAELSLASMLGQLCGNEHDMAGLAELRALLGGA